MVAGLTGMKRRLLLAAAWLLPAALAWAQPVVATSPPQRVVSLLPSLTETVCVLGACERLVGVDQHSNWPDPVKRLPRLGGLNDTSVEGIVALKPDLVLVPRSSRVLARLQGLGQTFGFRVAAIEPQTQAEARAAMTQVAELLGLPLGTGELAWQRAEQRFPAPAWPAPGASARPDAAWATVYYEVGSLYAASEASFIGDWLARLGARNIVPASLGTFPKLNPEFVVRADPWLIITSQRTAAEMPKRPGWAALGAVRAGRICALSPVQTEVLGRPGPRMAEAAEALADCLRRFAPGDTPAQAKR
jgi:iron complex transport system substrate-binding protein